MPTYRLPKMFESFDALFLVVGSESKKLQLL